VEEEQFMAGSIKSHLLYLAVVQSVQSVEVEVEVEEAPSVDHQMDTGLGKDLVAKRTALDRLAGNECNGDLYVGSLQLLI
jgi:hypothetical protein